jgi:hypothetical protein
MLMSFDGHAVPVDELMLAYLREQDVVDPQTPLAEIHRFIEHHVKAEECSDFFFAVRRASQELAGPDGEVRKKKSK